MSDPLSPCCPACGDSQLHWELHRLQARGSALTTKSIQWQCRRCGYAWLVPTRAEPGAFAQTLSRAPQPVAPPPP